jgi:protein SCO1
VKFVVACICLLLLCPSLHAAETKAVKGTAQQHAGHTGKASEKGLFLLELSVDGKELVNGLNGLDLVLLDKSGKPVSGAKLVVAPWSPATGRGVWDKPVVTERGNGKYRVENVSITMSGRWELKFDIAKDKLEDKAVFAFEVASSKPAAPEVSKAGGRYSRSVKFYNVPNVTLLDQEGNKVNFRSLLDSGKPVIIDFIYTTCTTICPVLSASFANLRRELGPDAEGVQLISISIDPEHDRPEQMKKYLSRFKAGKSWSFLTGNRDDIERLLRSLDAIVVDKMAHEPLYIMHSPKSEEWIRIKGMVRKGDLLSELRRMEKK